MGKLVSALLSIFTVIFSGGLKNTIEKLTIALLDNKIVEDIARLTPNRTDDEILRAYQRYRREGVYDPKKAPDVLLRDLAVAVLRDYAPGGTPTRLMILAVELAYNAYREKQK